MTTLFWNDPTILMNNNYIKEIYPNNKMSLENKINSIARFIIFFSLLLFIIFRNINIFILMLLMLIFIYLYYINKPMIEGYKNNPHKNDNKTVELDKLLKSDYYNTSKKNPFGNVLLTDINDNPDRKSAPPSFNPDVNENILKNVKKQTQMLNSGIINTNSQIYGDLYEKYNLDNSMKQFYSTANTRVCNDQGAFAQYLYGNMYSGKDDGVEGAIMRVKDNYRYILY